MPTEYNAIGKTYTSTRAADPRITSRLLELLDLPMSATIIDVGAGTGNYSFALAELGYKVTAVEPSSIMREQARPHPDLQWQDASAEALPFDDNLFDGAVMTLCLHHMDDWKMGLREALRVIGHCPLVIFAFDIEYKADFWLFDYFPEFIEIDRNWSVTLAEIAEFVEQDLQANFTCEAFPLPKDLLDHFAAASWSRPENYLQARYRNGISSFSKISEDTVRRGLELLENDLESGAWTTKYGELLEQEFYDRGYVFLKIQSKAAISS